MTNGRPAVEQDLTGIVRPPTGVNDLGVDRRFGAMMHDLRWEAQWGEQYAADSSRFV
jgi:hypothetical protein